MFFELRKLVSRKTSLEDRAVQDEVRGCRHVLEVYGAFEIGPIDAYAGGWNPAGVVLIPKDGSQKIITKLVGGVPVGIKEWRVLRVVASCRVLLGPWHVALLVEEIGLLTSQDARPHPFLAGCP